jgi:AraC family transcriptional regulator, transcriptional activator of pobA
MNYYFLIVRPENTVSPADDESELKEIYRLLRQFFKEYNKASYKNKFEVISSYLNILRIKTENADTTSISIEPYDRENYKYFQKFITMLEYELPNTHKVIDYSKKLGITARKLSAVCRACKGKSPKEIINEHLISESKRLLTNTPHPIKQIALQLGFADPYQFSKYFKNHEKVSPAFFRKRGK